MNEEAEETDTVLRITIQDGLSRLRAAKVFRHPTLDSLKLGTLPCLVLFEAPLPVALYKIPKDYWADKSITRIAFSQAVRDKNSRLSVSELLPYVSEHLSAIGRTIVARDDTAFANIVEKSFLNFGNSALASDPKIWADRYARVEEARASFLQGKYNMLPIFVRVTDIDELISHSPQARTGAVGRSQKYAPEEFWISLLKELDIKEIGKIQKQVLSKLAEKYVGRTIGDELMTETLIKRKILSVWNLLDLRHK